MANGLSAAFLAGPWTADDLVGRGRDALGLRSSRPTNAFLRNLAVAVIGAYPSRPADRPRELTSFIAARPELRAEAARRRERGLATLHISHWRIAPTEMTVSDLDLPMLDTVSELARWLGLSIGELDWYADVRSLERRVVDERLRHYRYRWIEKATGGHRLIESPKQRLAALQHRVLREILDVVPAHDAAHGFRAGRSVATFAAPHAGQPLVLRMDLEGFFDSIGPGRVFGVFRSAGYPEPVAHSLTGLMTNSVPLSARRSMAPPRGTRLEGAHARLLGLLAAPHLPQGASTSPAVANLCCRRLDARLSGLASSWGVTYTRYADDLAFSGGHSLRDHRLRNAIDDVILDEGFRIAVHKTRLRASHQQQRLTGLVVNSSPQPSRADRDLLRATLHDALSNGLMTANRSGHPDFAAQLRGRISWVASHNPQQGERLKRLFDQIESASR